MRPLEAGEVTVGPYRLLGRLGAGGMGRVYLARSAGGRTVAVKVVHPHFATDEEFRARFRREVDSARRVGTGPDGHRWSAPVLDADPEATVPWVATGYVAGPSLTQAVAGHGPLPERSVRALGAGLAEALTAVHGLGLVHRDVKPSNVLLALDGPRLIDFGIARATDGTASLTSTGVSVGSPGYMAPEQILGKGVTGAADVFSLGAVLAYAMTGASPFPGDSSAALLYKVVHEEPELGAVEGELRELIAHCLAKDPAARPTPGEVAGRLAPDGAAPLMAVGWLPGPLVEEVSRAAVRLLDLDAVPPAHTGPVPFTSASVGVGTTGGSASAAPALGVFGPPLDLPHDPSVPGARTGGGGAGIDPGSDPGTGSGLTVRRQGRRVGCTVALVVAGALAAVTVGAGILLDRIPDDNRKSSAGEKATTPPASSTSTSPGTTPSASAGGSPTGTPGSGSASVPAEFIGVWDGAITAASLPAGTMKVTLTKGSTGQRVGKAEQTDILGNFICEDLFTLKDVDGKTLAVESEKGPRSMNMCSEGPTGLRLTLEKDGLHYDSADPRAGSPTGVLTKQ